MHFHVNPDGVLDAIVDSGFRERQRNLLPRVDDMLGFSCASLLI